MNINVLDVIAGTTVDGPGLRTSVYLAGCPHHCPGCHNPESWDPAGGRPVAIQELLEEIERNGFNVTLSGGDPLCQPQAVLELLKELKRRDYNVWLYTGYTYEHIVGDKRLAPVLDLIDVLVDGPYRQDLRDISLLFRGSSNQRLIDVAATRRCGGEPVLWRAPWS